MYLVLFRVRRTNINNKTTISSSSITKPHTAPVMMASMSCPEAMGPVLLGSGPSSVEVTLASEVVVSCPEAVCPVLVGSGPPLVEVTIVGDSPEVVVVSVAAISVFGKHYIRIPI